jgi:hypothetical protein
LGFKDDLLIIRLTDFVIDMNPKDFLRLGVPLGEATRRATDFVAKFILGGGDKSRLREEVAAIVANPSPFVDAPLRGEFAKALISTPHPSPLSGRGGEGEVSARRVPVKYHQWGRRAGARGGDADGGWPHSMIW